mgnify:CR=1 FL=1
MIVSECTLITSQTPVPRGECEERESRITTANFEFNIIFEEKHSTPVMKPLVGIMEKVPSYFLACFQIYLEILGIRLAGSKLAGNWNILALQMSLLEINRNFVSLWILNIIK